MKPLPPIDQPRAVLSFDFDGTLHDPSQQPSVPHEFFAVIRRLRDEYAAVWGINTGRSMAQMVEGFIESSFPFTPDWVVAREREIYFPNDFGRWLPFTKWNKQCEKDIHKLFKKSRKLLKQVRHEVEEHTGAQWIELDGEPAGIIARTEEEMAWIVERIQPIVGESPDLSWQRNSIYLRFGHHNYQKGSSLQQVASIYNLDATQCFAMGDSHNDMEMLDPSCAAAIACPANAVPDVIAKVTSHGGYVASQSHGQAVIEALNHFLP